MYVLCVLIYCGFRLFTNEYIVIKPTRGAEEHFSHFIYDCKWSLTDLLAANYFQPIFACLWYVSFFGNVANK